MTIAIVQTHHQLGVKLVDVDGSTQIYNEFHTLSQGLIPPEFPDIGTEIVLQIGAAQHKAKIEFKTYTYFFSGDAITTLHTLVAKKIP